MSRLQCRAPLQRISPQPLNNDKNRKNPMPTSDQLAAPALDVLRIRSQFPSLSQTVNGRPAVFLDGPGGTQVPQRVIDAISNYLAHDNANTGGAYATSRRTDAMIAEARAAMADFLHCAADEVIFGPNMTTLTFAISRALGRELKPGDEILLTRLDHDANVSPWLLMAEDRGLTVRWADFRDEDCTLDMQDLASKLNKNTKLVAVGYASNAVGTINPVEEIVRLAHRAGALAAIESAYTVIHQHERALLERMATGLKQIPGLKIYGITDPAFFDQRCATFAVRIDGFTPLELATQLGERGFFTWDGNYYAISVTEHFDVERSGGFLRIGLVHYNTVNEVDSFLSTLREIASR